MEKKLSPHTEKLRVERAMMDLTGASRSQLRKGLRDFDTVVRGREALRPREAQPGKGAAGVQVQEVAQPIRELPPRPEKGGGGGAPGASESVEIGGSTTPFFKFENGTLMVYTLYYDTSSVV